MKRIVLILVLFLAACTPVQIIDGDEVLTPIQCEQGAKC
jgi:hypothetical protein